MLSPRARGEVGFTLDRGCGRRLGRKRQPPRTAGERLSLAARYGGFTEPAGPVGRDSRRCSVLAPSSGGLGRADEVRGTSLSGAGGGPVGTGQGGVVSPVHFAARRWRRVRGNWAGWDGRGPPVRCWRRPCGNWAKRDSRTAQSAGRWRRAGWTGRDGDGRELRCPAMAAGRLRLGRVGWWRPLTSRLGAGAGPAGTRPRGWRGPLAPLLGAGGGLVAAGQGGMVTAARFAAEPGPGPVAAGRADGGGCELCRGPGARRRLAGRQAGRPRSAATRGPSREQAHWAIRNLCEFSGTDGPLTVRVPAVADRSVSAGHAAQRRPHQTPPPPTLLAKCQQSVSATAPAATKTTHPRVDGALRVCRPHRLAEYYSRAPEYISVSMHESRAPSWLGPGGISCNCASLPAGPSGFRKFSRSL